MSSEKSYFRAFSRLPIPSNVESLPAGYPCAQGVGILGIQCGAALPHRKIPQSSSAAPHREIIRLCMRCTVCCAAQAQLNIHLIVHYWTAKITVTFLSRTVSKRAIFFTRIFKFLFVPPTYIITYVYKQSDTYYEINAFLLTYNLGLVANPIFCQNPNDNAFVLKIPF